MIDLDDIEQAARKPWYCRSKQEDNLLSPEVLVELITRLRQAEKDAARYLWLRGMRGGQLVVPCDIAGVPEVDKDGDLNFIWGDSLDTEIDEAMNGSNN